MRFIFVSWGESQSLDQEPYRDTFGRIGELRSFCSENVPLLCLSATVDHNNFDLICTSCAISKERCKIIYLCSDRPNIKLSVIKCSAKSVDCFEWVFWLIKNDGIVLRSWYLVEPSCLLVGCLKSFCYALNPKNLLVCIMLIPMEPSRKKFLSP